MLYEVIALSPVITQIAGVSYIHMYTGIIKDVK